MVILAKSNVWAPLVDADLVGEPLLRNVVASNVRPNHLAARRRGADRSDVARNCGTCCWNLPRRWLRQRRIFPRT